MAGLATPALVSRCSSFAPREWLDSTRPMAARVSQSSWHDDAAFMTALARWYAATATSGALAIEPG
ncbi:hypothetical protein ASD30_16245 [Nocardioides sp. Root140]|nr:hypothetical protein ASD30_16245 [Nocardioides sp. Root140]